MTRRRSRHALLVLHLLVAAASPARATRSGTLFSGPTSADPMSVYWNPAAMTLLAGTRGIVLSGVTFTRSTYDRETASPLTGQPYPRSHFDVVSPSPSAGLVSDLGGALEGLRVGLAATSPLLKGARWDDLSGGQPSSTRYHLVEGIWVPLTISAAAAYRINRYVAVGGGVELLGVWLSQKVMFDVGATLNQLSCQLGNGGLPCAVDAPVLREDPAYAAPMEVAGVGWGVGASFGLLVSPTRWLDLGAAVHTGNTVSVPLELSIDFPAAVAAFLRQNLPAISVSTVRREAEAAVLWPTTVTAGATVWALDRRLELSTFLHWARTSGGSLLVADVAVEQGDLIPAENELVRSADNELILHLRGAYQLTRIPLRVGLLLELTPAGRPEEWISPGTLSLTTLIVHAGLIWQATPWLAVSAEYGHFFSWSKTVRVSRFAPNPDPRTPVEAGLDRPSATGRYGGMVDRVAFGLLFGF